MENPLVSICIPTHEMQDKKYFLARLMSSIKRQTYKNYEIVITETGGMAENTNNAIKRTYRDWETN